MNTCKPKRRIVFVHARLSTGESILTAVSARGVDRNTRAKYAEAIVRGWLIRYNSRGYMMRNVRIAEWYGVVELNTINISSTRVVLRVTEGDAWLGSRN